MLQKRLMLSLKREMKNSPLPKPNGIRPLKSGQRPIPKKEKNGIFPLPKAELMKPL